MKNNGCLALGIGALFFCFQAAAQVVVYDNLAAGAWTAADQSTGIHDLSDEIGDEIDLVPGTPRSLSTFTVQYYAQNLTSADQMRVRLYENDGPLSPQGQPTPQSVLYDSGNIPVNVFNGRGSITLSHLNVTAPDTLIWTVQFTSLSGNKAASLAISTDATLGFSFGDYWEKTTSGWSLNQLSSPYTSNFGAELTTVPEPAATAGVLLATAFLGAIGIRFARWRQAPS